MRHWVITRERDDALLLVDALVARGVRATALSCIERRALPWPKELRPSTNVRTVVLCTSPFAAKILVDHGVRGEFAACAPATSRVLEAAGVQPAIVAEGGSVALAEAVKRAAPGARVLYPTSDKGVDSPEQARAIAILEEQCEVVRAIVYTTRPAPALAQQIDNELPRQNLGLVFFSPSAVDAFVEAAAAIDIRPDAVVCVGESTARAWDSRKKPAAVVAKSGTVVDVICALDRSA